MGDSGAALPAKPGRDESARRVVADLLPTRARRRKPQAAALVRTHRSASCSVAIVCPARRRSSDTRIVEITVPDVALQIAGDPGHSTQASFAATASSTRIRYVPVALLARSGRSVFGYRRRVLAFDNQHRVVIDDRQQMQVSSTRLDVPPRSTNCSRALDARQRIAAAVDDVTGFAVRQIQWGGRWEVRAVGTARRKQYHGADHQQRLHGTLLEKWHSTVRLDRPGSTQATRDARNMIVPARADFTSAAGTDSPEPAQPQLRSEPKTTLVTGPGPD